MDKPSTATTTRTVVTEMNINDTITTGQDYDPLRNQPLKPYKSNKYLWPRQLSVNSILKFPNEGVIHISMTLRSEIDFAFSLALSSDSVNRIHSSRHSNEQIQKHLMQLKLGSVAVYISKDNVTYDFYPNTIIRLSPTLKNFRTVDDVDNLSHPVSEATNRDYKPTQYLLMRLILESLQNFHDIHAVALLRSDRDQYEELNEDQKRSRQIWDSQDWTTYWNGIKNKKERPVSFFRSEILNIATECGLLCDPSHQLPRTDRKSRAQLVLLAVTGRVLHRNWRGEKKFVAKYKWITNATTVENPVFRLYYGFDKFSPLLLAPKFNMDQFYGSTGELNVVVTSTIPIRYKQQDPTSLEPKLQRKWDVLGTGSNVIFVALIMGNQSEDGTLVEWIGRSELVGFSTDDSGFRLGSMWITTIIIIILVTIFLFIIPSTNAWIFEGFNGMVFYRTYYTTRKYFSSKRRKKSQWLSKKEAKGMRKAKSNSHLEKHSRKICQAYEGTIPHQLSYITDEFGEMSERMTRFNPENLSDRSHVEPYPVKFPSRESPLRMGSETSRISSQTSITSGSSGLYPRQRTRFMSIVEEDPEDTSSQKDPK